MADIKISEYEDSDALSDGNEFEVYQPLSGGIRREKKSSLNNLKTYAQGDLPSRISSNELDVLNNSLELDTKTKWIYPWVDGQTYKRNTITRIGEWTTIAIGDTTDYPAPVPNNDLDWHVQPEPTWSTVSVVGDLIYGYKFTTAHISKIRGCRIWTDGSANNQYTVQLWNMTDEINPVLVGSHVVFNVVDIGWKDVLMEDLLSSVITVPGDQYRISVILHNVENDVNYCGQWEVKCAVSNPSDGVVSLQGSSTIFINKKEYGDGLDRGADLSSLKIGDIITLEDENNIGKYTIYRVTGTLIDHTTYYEIPVDSTDSGDFIGSNTIFNITWSVKGASVSTDYKTITNAIPTYFPGGEVEGFYSTSISDITNPVLPTNANVYGIDFLGESYALSSSWEIVSYSPADDVNTSSLPVKTIRSLNGNISLDFLDDNGADVGVRLRGGQFSVGEPGKGNETVLGQGDSYPVPFAYHCEIANTSGLTIVNAIDVKNTLQRDTISSIGLFGGVTAGKYILVGSDHKYGGTKTLFAALGSVDPNNITAEYLKDNTPAWITAPFMATDANGDLVSFANEIGTVENEQWRFGFNPLLGTVPDWDQVTLNINGIPLTKYWARFRIETDIVTDPIVQQLKLHTARMEVNADGTSEYFGSARFVKTLKSGIGGTIPNYYNDPNDEYVAYGTDFKAKYRDNEFKYNVKDGFGIVQGIDEGLDTSIPLVLSVSYYIKGTGTGDINFGVDVYQIEDGFVYDGTAVPETFKVVQTISTPSNRVRQTMQLLVGVNTLKADGSAVLISLYRDGNTAEDTLSDNVIVTNITLTGYFYK